MCAVAVGSKQPKPVSTACITALKHSFLLLLFNPGWGKGKKATFSISLEHTILWFILKPAAINTVVTIVSINIFIFTNCSFFILLSLTEIQFRVRTLGKWQIDQLLYFCKNRNDIFIHWDSLHILQQDTCFDFSFLISLGQWGLFFFFGYIGDGGVECVGQDCN